MNYETLIIDDDDIALFLHETILQDCGFANELKTFNKAQHALAYIESYQNSAVKYLIFLDINMPVMNGWRFLEALENYPNSADIKVIMVTSSIEKSDKERAMSVKFVNAYLEKPLKQEQIRKLQNNINFKDFFISNGR
ncbi:response regulator [Pedobacter mendelii]|uniref:Response regulator n=1 Tax=Pedobacter mendelii TaxID=1908240 RepID=A0ABQ2BG77_9SPHI|nr:response regulator [Pedobacter mendelii]GGI24873.1 response regulator [Pedobacter mendelii]